MPIRTWWPSTSPRTRCPPRPLRRSGCRPTPTRSRPGCPDPLADPCSCPTGTTALRSGATTYGGHRPPAHVQRCDTRSSSPVYRLAVSSGSCALSCARSWLLSGSGHTPWRSRAGRGRHLWRRPAEELVRELSVLVGPEGHRGPVGVGIYGRRWVEPSRTRLVLNRRASLRWHGVEHTWKSRAFQLAFGGTGTPQITHRSPPFARPGGWPKCLSRHAEYPSLLIGSRCPRGRCPLSADPSSGAALLRGEPAVGTVNRHRDPLRGERHEIV